MRALLLIAAVVLVAGSASQPPQQQQGQPEAQQDPTGCGAACYHYLNCKGIQDGNMHAQCVGESQARGVDPSQTYAFTQMDCATAIYTVESQMQQGGEGGQPQQQGGQCNADCHGCVWDGSTCYYHAASGAGVVSECDACCCAPGGPAKRWD